MRVLKLLFIICGANFYMKWLLPTNPTSNNKLFIWAFYGGRKRNTFTYNSRISFGALTGSVHLFCALPWINDFLNPINVFVNLYPIIVQTYFITRCYHIKKQREQFHFGQLKTTTY